MVLLKVECRGLYMLIQCQFEKFNYHYLDNNV